jgi:hypothetical protein
VATPPDDAQSYLDAIAVTGAEREQAVRDADALELRWREAIKAAIGAGVRVLDIATTAGISRERVYQIRDGRR